MGGHSKKSGRGGGHHGGRGNAPPTEKKKLTKDPGVPDLKDAARRLAHTARRKSHCVLSIGTNLHNNNNNSRSVPPILGGGRSRGGVLGRSGLTAATLLRGAQQGEAAPQTEEERMAAQQREMRTLLLRTTERVHDYEAPIHYAMGGDGNEEDEDEFSEDAVQRRGCDQSLRRFFKEFQRVVENCDVLLQVVDARDPLGCRLKQLENNIRSTYGDEKKKVVVVLNKVDLLPSKEVVDAWVHYFEHHEHMMCIPFAATAKGSLGQNYITNMYRQLRNIARSEETGERKAIVVGVIGYPNVGKSSIINALKRKHVVGVGNMPGFTTGNTEVELRSDIRVMDCPGVVSPGEDSGDVVLRNAVKLSEIANPFVPVQRLLQRFTAANMPGIDAQQHLADVQDVEEMRAMRMAGVHPLALFYGIGNFDEGNVMSFIHEVGLRRGRLLKGGVVDEEGTARMILADWNNGRIAYYTYPPAVDALFGTTHVGSMAASEVVSGEAELVHHLAKGITLDGLPTFHLCVDRMREGLSSNKKAWRQGADDDDDDDDDDDEELL